MKGNSILITGGTGSFGKQFVKTLVDRHPEVERIVIFSRDELKQYEMAQLYPREKFPQLRFFLGDIRDAKRVQRAFEGIDTVVHAAALKQVPAAEYNPFEFINTNIIGAQNIIDACLDHDVKKVVALSTDKAAAPINLYGATKLCSDKLFVAANNPKGSRDIAFSVVRYGNVFGSRGSVIPLFLKQRESGELSITDRRMTRFNITLQQGVDMVLKALDIMWGGEIFVPKIPSYRIMDVVEAVAPNCNVREIGIRPGEKLHEEMITETDAANAVMFDNYFVILPSKRVFNVNSFMKRFNGHICDDGFRYNSGTNEQWLKIEEIRKMVEDYQANVQ